MKRLTPLAAALMLALTGCGGGGGGSSSGGSSGNGSNSDGEVLSSLTTGISLPSEISAVPVSDSSSNSSKTIGSFAAAVRGLARAQTAAALPATSDYKRATPRVYVEERALEQFDIIEQVMKAVAQTNYADEANVNQGPYKAMIAWEDEQNGKSVKQLQTWTVESRMIVKDLPSDVTGNDTGDVNRLLAWIPEVDMGEESLIKAEFLIYTAPTLADDGAVLNYGEWDMNVIMDASTTGVDPSGTPASFFAASARVAEDGSSTLKVHDKFTFDMGDEMGMDGGSQPMEFSEETRGILIRTTTGGYGKVAYPDWDACWQMDFNDPNAEPPCMNGVPVLTAQYAYTDRDLAVQELDANGTADEAVYKDRILDGAIRVIHRYKMFYADADANAGIAEGDDIEKHKSFGFPLSYGVSGENGNWNEFGYYGAWQGRHQFWGGGNYTGVGGQGTPTTFTRQDVPPDQTAPTYTLRSFNGTLTKRNVVEADLADIQGIVVETWINKNYNLTYDLNAGQWKSCQDGWVDHWQFDQNGNQMPPQCIDFETGNSKPFTTFSDYGALVQDSSGRKWVNIGRWDEQSMQQTEYVYLTSNPNVQGLTYSGAGFYPAEWGNQGNMVPKSDANGGGLYSPADADNLWVNIGGSIYISYTGDFNNGTGWVQKSVTGFDQNTWTATFDANGDTNFNPPRGTEYYMNANGSNYIVKRKTANGNAADYDVSVELQTAANPVNVATILPSSTVNGGSVYLKAPWDPNVRYGFVSDTSSTNYMKLKYLTDDPNTNDVDESAVETAVTDGQWGLQVWDNMGTAGDYSDDKPLTRTAEGTVQTVDVDEWGFPMDGQLRPTEFNWEYSSQDGGWGSQQYLIDADGDYVILSDPINLVSVGLYDNLGNPVKIDPNGADITVGTDEDNWKKVMLQFDGWMHGMPDMYHELAKNNWEITGLGEKVRRLLAGQKVTDSMGVEYFVKPMDMSLFLGEISEQSITDQGRTVPDLTQADSVNLSSVPNFVAHGMGAMPTTQSDGVTPLEVKYSEGQPLN